MSDGKERRKQKREDVKVLITEKKKSKVVVTHSTGNISEGGVQMQTESPIAADPEAEYIFQLPTEDEYINVKGKIVYRESKDGKAPGKYGIEFTDLDKKSLDMIKKFMKINGID